MKLIDTHKEPGCEKNVRINEKQQNFCYKSLYKKKCKQKNKHIVAHRFNTSDVRENSKRNSE